MKLQQIATGPDFTAGGGPGAFYAYLPYAEAVRVDVSPQQPATDAQGSGLFGDLLLKNLLQQSPGARVNPVTHSTGISSEVWVFLAIGVVLFAALLTRKKEHHGIS